MRWNTCAYWPQFLSSSNLFWSSQNMQYIFLDFARDWATAPEKICLLENVSYGVEKRCITPISPIYGSVLYVSQFLQKWDPLIHTKLDPYRKAWVMSQGFCSMIFSMITVPQISKSHREITAVNHVSHGGQGYLSLMNFSVTLPKLCIF